MTNFTVNGDSFFPSNLVKQDHNHPIGFALSPSGFVNTSKGFKVNTFDCQTNTCDINTAAKWDKIKFRMYSSQLKQYIKYNGQNADYE